MTHRNVRYAVLENINDWDLDIFGLAAVEAASPMALVALKIFHERGLFQRLQLDVRTAMNFFCTVHITYKQYPEVKFHNDLHGTDVLHSVHCCLNAPALNQVFSDLEIFAALVAAAVHDVAHPGATNNFLIKTGHDLALLYNDTSVLENHHISTAFKIMQDAHCNILSGFSVADYLAIRKLMIDMVLSTDMSKHAQFLGEFKDLTQKTHSAAGASAAGTGTGGLGSGPSSDEVGVGAGAGTPEAAAACAISESLASSYEKRALVLCSIIHSADLGNCAKEWSICQTWAYRLIEEFWEEGDKERELGLEIGMLNDRHKVVVPKSQVGFINFVTLPLWKAWASYVSPGVDTIQLKRLGENLEKWQALVDQPTLPTLTEVASPTTEVPASPGLAPSLRSGSGGGGDDAPRTPRPGGGSGGGGGLTVGGGDDDADDVPKTPVPGGK